MPAQPKFIIAVVGFAAGAALAQRRRDYPERVLGPGTDVIDANEEMWRFFRRFALPAGRQ